MRRCYTLATFLLVICLLCLLSTGTQAQAPQEPQRVHILPVFDPIDLALSLEDKKSAQTSVALPPVLPRRSQADVTLETAFRRKDPWDGRDLLSEEDRHVLWSASARSARSDTRLMGEGEIMPTSFDPRTGAVPLVNQHVLLRLDHKLPQRGGHYGLRYGYVGKDVKHQSLRSDQEGLEVWGKWPVGIAGLQTSLTQWWDNVDNDPGRPRLTTVQGKVAVDLAPRFWPVLRLFYARDTIASAQEPEGGGRTRHWRDTVGVTLSYYRPSWEATLTSTSGATMDKLQPGQRVLDFTHRLRVSYRLQRAMTITPTVSLYEESYAWSHMRTTSPEASLTLVYNRLFGVFDVSMYGAYISVKSSDGSLATRSLDTTGGLTWYSGGSSSGRVTISAKIGYSQFLDAVSPLNSSEGFSGALVLNIAAL